VYDSDDGYIYTMAADGTQRQRVSSVRGLAPKYSPDGEKISLYYFDVGTREEWLATINTRGDSSSFKTIAFVKSILDFGLLTYAWSPDGSKLAFNRTVGEFLRSDICVVDSGGGEVKQLTNVGHNFDPTWSPDGQLISFRVTEDSAIQTYIMSQDGSSKRRASFLARGIVLGLKWSPNGELIAFTGRDSTVAGQTNDVYVCDKEGKNVRRLTFDGKSGIPVWSPDGRKILFASGRDGGANLYTMNPDGSGQSPITSAGNIFTGVLLWSPDAKKIAYATKDVAAQRFDIHVVSADGSNDIDTNTRLVGGFDWKPK